MTRVPPPSNLRYPPFGTRELPDRREPLYAEPLSRNDIRELLYLLPAAAFVVAGLWAFCVLMIVFVGEPGR